MKPGRASSSWVPVTKPRSDHAARWFGAEVVRSPWWLSFIILLCLVSFFAEAIAIAAGRGVLKSEAATAMLAALPSAVWVVLCADTAANFHVSRTQRELRAPFVHAMELLPLLAIPVATALTFASLRDSALVDTDEALSSGEFEHARKSFVQVFVVVTQVLEPLVLLKALAAVWRLRTWHDLAGGEAQQTRARYAHRIRELMVVVSALSLLLFLGVSWGYSQFSVSVEGHEIGGLVHHLSDVADDEAALRHYAESLGPHMNQWVVLRAYIGDTAIDLVPRDAWPDSVVSVSAADHMGGGGHHGAAGGDRGLTLDSAHFVRELARWSSARKALMVAFVATWSVAFAYLTDVLVLGPLCALLANLAGLSGRLDEKGLVKMASHVEGDEGAEDGDGGGLTLQEVLRRVGETVQLVMRASRRGQLVLDRMAREAAADGGVTGEGVRDWALMYMPAPAAGLAAARSMGQQSAYGASSGGAVTMHGEAKRHTVSGYTKRYSLAMSEHQPSSGELDDIQSHALGTYEWNALEVPFESLERAVLAMFRGVGAVNDGSRSTASMPQPVTVLNLVARLSSLYDQANPYHNWYHACEVAHACYRMLKEADAAAGPGQPGWSRLERLCLMVAAIAHDVGHTGASNDFLIKTQHSLAIRYNDASPQEQSHVALLYEIMLAHPDCNVFAQLRRDAQASARRTVIACIKASDMKVHFDLIATLEEIKEAVGAGRTYGILPASPQHREALLGAMLHASDISHLLLPRRTMFQWSFRVVQEFFAQGDAERQLELGPTIATMDRAAEYVPVGQLGFMDAVLRPFMCALVSVAPWHAPLLPRFRETYREWLGLVAYHQEQVVREAGQGHKVPRPPLGPTTSMRDCVASSMSVPPKLLALARAVSVHSETVMAHPSTEDVDDEHLLSTEALVFMPLHALPSAALAMDTDALLRTMDKRLTPYMPQPQIEAQSSLLA
ncbi:unnamed protein product [Pedinophyceae sp. YPF-701]|nr:unnamed protein product [Pedinophyceae sp. YPF-701]